MHDSYPVVVLGPVIGVGAYCLAQVLVARSATGYGPYHSLKVGFVGGLIVAAAITVAGVCTTAISPQDRIGYVVLNLLTYLALAFGYFNFVNLAVASLRIRLLEEICKAGGALPGKALTFAYNSRAVVTIRLQRLVQGGHLVEENGRLRSGRLQFLVVARIFDVLHWFIFGRRGKKAHEIDDH